jgi:hypothetical protein
MPSWKTLFRSDHFISAVELENKRPTMTIDRVQSVKLEQEDGSNKDKPVIFFKEIHRGWVFCKTTGFCLAAMFGDDFSTWPGKRVTLHSEMVQVGPKKEPGIRVTGSPDIEKPLAVKIKLAKRKAFVVKLVPTQAPKGGPELRDAPPPPPEDQASPPDTQDAPIS